jgi:hypothetical protein
MLAEAAANGSGGGACAQSGDAYGFKRPRLEGKWRMILTIWHFDTMAFNVMILLHCDVITV